MHTLAQAKLNLANDEAAEEKNGMITLHDMSPSNFILAIFDIEVVNSRGNPGVSAANPYPTPQKPLPLLRGKGFGGYG